jgi:hypothetical protein
MNVLLCCRAAGLAGILGFTRSPLHFIRLFWLVPCRFTAFQIEVRTRSGLTWTVDHRYRQFLALNKVHTGAFPVSAMRRRCPFRLAGVGVPFLQPARVQVSTEEVVQLLHHQHRGEAPATV